MKRMENDSFFPPSLPPSLPPSFLSSLPAYLPSFLPPPLSFSPILSFCFSPSLLSLFLSQVFYLSLCLLGRQSTTNFLFRVSCFLSWLTGSQSSYLCLLHSRDYSCVPPCPSCQLEWHLPKFLKGLASNLMPPDLYLQIWDYRHVPL
jgi:hypothetical protein